MKTIYIIAPTYQVANDAKAMLERAAANPVGVSIKLLQIDIASIYINNIEPTTQVVIVLSHVGYARGMLRHIFDLLAWRQFKHVTMFDIDDSQFKHMTTFDIDTM